MKPEERTCEVYKDPIFMFTDDATWWSVFRCVLLHPTWHGIYEPGYGLYFLSSKRSVDYEMMELSCMMSSTDLYELRTGLALSLLLRHTAARTKLLWKRLSWWCFRKGV